jgi:hypothetical protein
MEIEEQEINIEDNSNLNQDIEQVFGRKIALGLIAQNWKYKEMALKIIYK